MLTLELLNKMLLAAAAALKENVIPLCELDSVAGDGDHGLTIGRMADAMKAQVEAGTSADMKELLDDLSMAFMGVNGGSAGPLWGTVFGGFAEGTHKGAYRQLAVFVYTDIKRTVRCSLVLEPCAAVRYNG